MIRLSGENNSMTVNGVELSESELTALNGVSGNVQTSKQDTLVSGTNIKTINGSSLLGSGNVVTTVANATETAAGIVELATNAEVVTGTDTVRAVTPAGMKAGLNATGTAPIYACRAWVNFDGTGTVSIRASGNVSSITDNAAGRYFMNFSTAMPDANYGVSGSAMFSTTSYNNCYFIGGAVTSSQAFVGLQDAGAITYDGAYISAEIFR